MGSGKYRDISFLILLFGMMTDLNSSHADYTLSHPIYNPNPTGFDRFGAAYVGVGEDRILAGASLADTTQADVGVAYLLEVTSGAVLATYQNPTPNSGDGFGVTVAAVGESLAVVGAHQDDGSAANGGAVHVFDMTTGAHLRTLISPNPTAGGLFGIDVALKGDVLLVGAPLDEVQGATAGVVYFFDPYTGDYLGEFMDPDPEGGELFGRSISVMGGDVFITSVLDDAAGLDSGSVHLFNWFTKEWVMTFVNPSPDPNDNFGLSVLRIGCRVFIGSVDDDTVANNSGAVHIYDRNSGNLIDSIYDPTGRPDRRFGNLSRACSNFMVGAPASNLHSFESGNAYLFDLETGDLIQSTSSESPSTDDRYGGVVAEVGNRLLISDFDDSTFSPRSGAIYVYEDPGITSCPENLPASAPVVSITPAAPDTLDDLTCVIDVESVDPDCDPVVYSYEWFRNGALVFGATDSVLSASHTSWGDFFHCVVTPNDCEIDGATGETLAVFIGNSAERPLAVENWALFGRSPAR